MITRQMWNNLGRLSQNIQRNYSAMGNGSVQLAYTSFQSANSPPKGPPLIIIHGLFGSKKNWQSLAKAISQKGRKVVTVDLRNHGESPHTPEMNLEAMSGDIKMLMSELKMDQSIIVGHSLGGKVAMTFALTQPDLVSKLVIEDVAPTVTRTSQMTKFPQYIAAMKSVHFNSSLNMNEQRREAGKLLKPSIQDIGELNFILTNISQEEDGYRWKVNLDAINNNLDTIVGFPKFDTQYYGPTLFLGGKLSNHITEKDYPSINQLFPNAEIGHIDGAGHWVHAEKPHQFLQALTKFIDS